MSLASVAPAVSPSIPTLPLHLYESMPPNHACLPCRERLLRRSRISVQNADSYTNQRYISQKKKDASGRVTSFLHPCGRGMILTDNRDILDLHIGSPTLSNVELLPPGRRPRVVRGSANPPGPGSSGRRTAAGVTSDAGPRICRLADGERARDMTRAYEDASGGRDRRVPVGRHGHVVESCHRSR